MEKESKKPKKEEIKIPDDLLLRIQMNHSSKEVSKINFAETVYFSVLHEFPSKSKYKIQAVILGIFLSEEEDAKSYVPSLQNAAKSLDDLGEYDPYQWRLFWWEPQGRYYLDYREQTQDYFDFSVFWARAIALILLFVTGLWPVVGLYILAALLMKPEPVIPIENEAEQEFYNSYTHSRHGAAQRLKRRYQNLERRIRRMEHIVTTPEYNWEKRFNG